MASINDSTSIQLKYQSFDIRFEDKPCVGTPICRNLIAL